MNKRTCMVLVSNIFDTYQGSDVLEAMIKRLDEKMHEDSDEYIIIASSIDNCITKLSNKCKTWFEQMGSVHINSLSYRCAFCFVGMLSKTST